MAWGDGDDGWSQPTHVGGSAPGGPDLAYVQRRAASFGGGAEPHLGDSLRGFVRRYGWRAYALPMLVVISVVALLTARTSPTQASAEQPSGPRAGGGPVVSTPTPSTRPSSAQTPGPGTSSSSAPPVAPSSIPLKSDAGGGKVNNTMITKAALPAGPPFTMRGDGTFRVIPGHSGIAGRTGPLYRYDIEVENGVTGVNLKQFATLVQTTLADPRSWSGHGVRVQRVDSGSIDFHVSLTSAITVRAYCGYTIPVETSCYAPAGSAAVATENRVVLDVARWVRGAAPYANDLTDYRIYMINHEDGHAMGHEHAHQCLPGGLAPVMMQQTFGLRSAVTGQLCGANPWPYPPGVKGAPGAEAPDTPQNSEWTSGGD